MGIFDALTTAVSGLQAQSFALQNISGNIANSQTASSGVCQPGIVPTPRDTERLAQPSRRPIFRATQL